MMSRRSPLIFVAPLACVAVLAAGCGAPTSRPRPRRPPPPRPTPAFRSGECNNVTDADIAKAVGSATFTKVVDSDAGCFWQENTMLGSFGAGMGISTWWYRGSDMDTERMLETAGRAHADRTVRRNNKGFKAFDGNACSIYVAKGGDVITWSIQTMNPADPADLCASLEKLAQLSQDRVN